MPVSFEDWLSSNYGTGGVAAAAQTTSTAGTAQNPNVYLGRKNANASPGQAGAAGVSIKPYVSGYNINTGATNSNRIDDVTDYDTASASIYSWSEEERSQLAKRLYNAGILEDPSDMKALASLWADATYQTGMMYTQSGGKTKLTPLQYLSQKIDTAITGGFGAPNVPKTTTNTSTQIVLPDKSDAQASVSTLFQESLGRAPTDDEMERYVSMMMSSYKKNPATTTTKTTTDRTGNSTSKSTTTGQYNPAEDLKNKAQADPEWGAYQAATTYFNAMQSAMAAPAQLA